MKNTNFTRSLMYLNRKLTYMNLFRALAVGLLLALPLVGSAQEEKAWDADVPGRLIVDFGFNFITDTPETTDFGFWGSKGIGLYYLYDFKLSKNGRLTFNPGVGVGLEKYSFDDDQTLTYGTNDSLQIIALSDQFGGDFDFKKSKIAATYLDIPLEIRWNLSKNNPNGFKLAVGGKIGLLLASHTKVRYDNGDRIIKDKRKDDFELSNYRATVIGRIGIGGFNIFYEQAVTTLWRSGGAPVGFDDAAVTKIGISFVGF